MSDYFKQELSDFKNSSKKLREDLLNYFRGIEFGASTLYDPANWGSLTHYYPLDEDANDDVGTVDLTVEGSPNTPTGVANGAYAFDGNDDRLINQGLNGSGLPTQSFTMSVWFSLPNKNASKGIFVHGANPDIGIIYNVSNDVFVAGLTTVDDGTQFFNSGTSASLDTKYHVSLTYDGSQAELYINGASEATLSATGDIDYQGSDLAIGYDIFNSTYNSLNYVDEAMIFDTALSPTEIDTLYQAGV